MRHKPAATAHSAGTIAYPPFEAIRDDAGNSNDSRKPAIIYARYSSELQKDSSIEDQVRLCRQALREDERLVGICTDQAMSGTHLGSRPGARKLLDELEKGACSVIIAEGLDRLSREMEDTARIHRLADFHGVEIRTLIDGPVNRITLGFRGAMNGMQLDDLKQRTRRGQTGRILAGRAAGGLPYGYDMQYLNDEGLPERGLRRINPEQAAVVRRIYEEYVAGTPVARIVRRLNGDGVPGPRGGKWSAVTLTGHYDRGDGILQNAIYRGLLVWGRCPEVRHPVSNKRHIRTSAPDERVTQEAPHLRIVEDDLWFAARALREARHRTHRKRQSFSKFTLPCYCGVCGGEMTRTDQRYLMCAAFKRHRTCANDRRYAVARIFEVLCEHLSAHSDGLWRGWKEELEAACAAAADQTGRLERKIAQKEAGNRRLIDALSAGLSASRAVTDRILENEREIEALKRQLQATVQLPDPAAFRANRFQPALARAVRAGGQTQFLLDHVKAVSLARDDDGRMVIAAVEPNFAAIAALAGDTGDDPACRSAE